jgi:hypothetical protein
MFEFLENYRDVAIDAPNMDGVVLTSRLRDGLTDGEIPVGVPLQARELWQRTSGGVLMRDLQFGICGLTLHDPDEAKKVSGDRAQVGYDVTESDWVVGEFIGDTDMLIIDENNKVLISTGSYSRESWYVFTSLENVLKRYVESYAEKYWEINE